MMHTDGTNVNRNVGRTNRKAAQGAATRAALLEAGRELFGTQGFAETSAEDLAAKAAVTKGALYHHFKGKDDLFRVVYEQVKRDITDAVAPAFLERDPWIALVHGCSRTVDCHLDPAVRRIVLVDGPSVLGTDIVRDVELRYGAIVLRGALRKAMNAGVVERAPLATLARLLNGAITEGCTVVASADDPVRAREEVDAVITRMLEGLRPRPDAG